MRMFALFDLWIRHRLKPGEERAPVAPVFDEDRSSMADLVRLLSRLDAADGFRVPR